MNPSLEIYELNTFTWLHNLSQVYGRSITLANVPPAEWDGLAALKLNSVWLMGVWQRSPQAVGVNRTDAGFMAELESALPDLDPTTDLIGSAYSIRDFTVEQRLGGDKGLVVARRELNRRGLKLILDFVPNHVAFDHTWASEHPEYFIRGDETDLDHQPDQFVKLGDHIFAYGRDPMLKPWIDVIQVNAFSPELRRATIDLLGRLSQLCDGVRCDMAMLMLKRIFASTWGERAALAPATEYWHDLIGSVKAQRPDFIFIGEAYWGTQNELMGFGFDYCYDKEWLDYLLYNNSAELKQSLKPPLADQARLIRFIENHDEKRSAAVFPAGHLRLAALLSAVAPGSHLYYHGQLEGRRLRTPVQLARDRDEPTDDLIKDYYRGLFSLRQEVLPLKSFTLINRPRFKESALVWRFDGASASYLAAANLDASPIALRLARPKAGSIELVFDTLESELKVTSRGASLRVALDGYQAAVWRIGALPARADPAG